MTTNSENMVGGLGRSEPETAARRRAIVDLVAHQSIGNQAELGRLLGTRGIRATQATLSRDLKALGIGKVPSSDGGYSYVLPAAPREVVDRSRTSLEVGAFLVEMRLVANLVLVRTAPGNAQGVARAIDNLGWVEVEGTVSGDDTILVVTASPAVAQQFRDRLNAMMGRNLE